MPNSGVADSHVNSAAKTPSGHITNNATLPYPVSHPGLAAPNASMRKKMIALRGVLAITLKYVSTRSVLLISMW